MEPSLLEVVIKYAGGEDKYTTFIIKLLNENKDKNLISFVKKNLTPDRPLKVGNPLPELKYKSLSDTTNILTTNIFRGNYLLIDIWATWCRPCIEEFPGLLEVYKNKDENLKFLSISIDKNAIIPIWFLENKFAIPWQKGLAIKSKDILDALMIDGIPCTILVSPEGKILSYGFELRGENLKNTLSEKIK